MDKKRKRNQKLLSTCTIYLIIQNVMVILMKNKTFLLHHSFGVKGGFNTSFSNVGMTSLRAYSHQTKVRVKAKKIKEQAKRVREYATDIKENVRFRFRFRSV